MELDIVNIADIDENLIKTKDFFINVEFRIFFQCEKCGGRSYNTINMSTKNRSGWEKIEVYCEKCDSKFHDHVMINSEFSIRTNRQLNEDVKRGWEKSGDAPAYL